MSQTEPTTLLLTGVPGVGKTTVLRELPRRLGPQGIRGFYTEEIRQAGTRRGFELIPFHGQPRRVLAHVDLRSRHRVGKYGVDVEMLEQVAVGLLAPDPAARLYLVDEIGKMECLSRGFVGAMRRLLDAGVPLVAAVAARGGGFIAEVKARPGTELWQLTRANRDAMPERILGWVGPRLPRTKSS